MVPENDEAGAAAGTATAGQECLERIPPNSTTRPNPASTIEVLAELFPVFVADWRQPHLPLKLGIHQNLIDRGVLPPDQCRTVFRVYAGRRQYQKAVAAGGLRYDLDGNPAGEVTAEHQEFAKEKLVKIKARMKARGKAKASAPPKLDPVQVPRRLGLADLKAAAKARKIAESEGRAVDPARTAGDA
jgi:ProP effector